MADSTWSEGDSRVYRELAAVAVPQRERLMATLLALVPFGRAEPFRAVELGCGEGFLSRALLEAFSAAQVLALDGSASMRAVTGERLSSCSGRGRVAPFELAADEWRDSMRGCHLVFSSLCVHHLDGTGKAKLFSDVFEALEPGGAFLLIDLLEPASELGRDLFAEQWDESTARRSRGRLGHDGAFELFRRERWNHYRFPDAVDRPSTLWEQLGWLRCCGFRGVDCFLLVAGHGVFGGFKNRGDSKGSGLRNRISLDRATRAVRASLESPP